MSTVVSQGLNGLFLLTQGYEFAAEAIVPGRPPGTGTAFALERTVGTGTARSTTPGYQRGRTTTEPPLPPGTARGG